MTGGWSAEWLLPYAFGMSAEASDEELMMAYARGDARAFETLYSRHRGTLYRFVLRALRQDRASADEVFQDTWSRVIAARERYVATAKFSTWLLQIANNLLTDTFRKRKPQLDGDAAEVVLSQVDGPEHERPESRLSEFEQRRRLQIALAQLPDEQRTVFVLRAENELSLEEIAETTGVGRETVKSRLRYALAKLRECLQ
jgi:RNA polymerase sigma-70 factor (ECF subfamily)